MAIHDLTVSTGSRTGRQSAAARDNFIERGYQYDRDRSELKHSECCQMPEWAVDYARGY